MLSVGCGWHPGRHLFPRPAWRLTGVDLEPAMLGSEELDAGVAGRAGELAFAPASFDIVLYRLVLHHIAFQGPLAPVFAEAARLLRPGGALVAVEPGLWHPVGAGLALANRTGLGTRVHGTPDDIPLSPRELERLARGAGLEPELHAVTFGWRRLPARCAARATPPRPARLAPAPGPLRSHAAVDRPPQLRQRHAEPRRRLNGRAGKRPALALVETERARLGERGEQAHRAVAALARLVQDLAVELGGKARPPPVRAHEQVPELRQGGLRRRITRVL